MGKKRKRITQCYAEHSKKKSTTKKTAKKRMQDVVLGGEIGGGRTTWDRDVEGNPAGGKNGGLKKLLELKEKGRF